MHYPKKAWFAQVCEDTGAAGLNLGQGARFGEPSTVRRRVMMQLDPSDLATTPSLGLRPNALAHASG
jgi:hypothetical protein